MSMKMSSTDGERAFSRTIAWALQAAARSASSGASASAALSASSVTVCSARAFSASSGFGVASGGATFGETTGGVAGAAGAPAGAAFVLLDEAVVRAGLAPEQAGLALNWRIGPSRQDFGASSFVQLTQTGGVRARTPLAPVHLRVARQADGDAALRWIRRGRIGADSWLADDIPLGEEVERYRVEIATEGAVVKRVAEVGEPSWTYAAAQIAADFPALPATAVIAGENRAIAPALR